jgi:signal transduction histidine kinase
MSLTVSTTLYRIIQEALTNVAKHSNAREVSIIIDNRDSNIVLVVEDDGVGFDENSIRYGRNNGLGLHGISERAALLRGSVEVEPTPGKGTTLYITIPTGDNSHE